MDFSKEVNMVDLLTGPITLTPTHLVGNVDLLQMVNDDSQQLRLGSACCNKIEFEVQDLDKAIDSIEGMEFTYEKVCEDTNTEYPQFNKGAVEVLYGGLMYVATPRAPFISVWDTDPIEQIGTVADPPPLPVESFVVQGGKLYALHSESPFVTAYAVSGNTLVKQPQIKMTDYQISQVQRYCYRKTSMLVDAQSITYYSVDFYNERPVRLVESVWQRFPMGVFIAEEPTRVNATKYKVVAYDRMSKFDIIVDEWVDSLTYPISLRNLLIALCQKCGVPFDGGAFDNQDFMVGRSFTSENLTGRKVLQWIAEAAGGFATITANGSLKIGYYASSAKAYGPEQIFTAEVADYAVEPITKVQIRATDNDIGVIVGTGENAYIVQDNPLLYATSDVQIRPVAQTLLNRVGGISYTPATIGAFADPSITPGVYFTLNTAPPVRCLLMERRVKGGKDTVKAVGNKLHEAQPAENYKITALNRKTNELIRTVDETRSELSDAQGNISTLTQTVEGITTRVADAEGSISTLTQTADEFRTRITDAEGAISEVTQTADGIKSIVNDPDIGNSVIAQTAEGLTATVSGLSKAQDATKLTFDENGLTIYNAGFRINVNNRDVFYVDSTGNLNIVGAFTTNVSGGNYARLTGYGLTFYDSSNNDKGSIYYSAGNTVIVSVDQFFVRKNSAPFTSAGSFYNQNGNSILSCTTIQTENLNFLTFNGRAAGWYPITEPGLVFWGTRAT